MERRSEPVYEEILPTQQTIIERAIAELNNAVDVTTENANKTGEDRTQVSNIKDEIVDLKEDIDANAELATEKAQEAVNASLRSEASAQNAAEYESNAHDYSDEAKDYAQQALESKIIASQKATIATDASVETLGYRDETLVAKNDVLNLKQDVIDYKNETKGYLDETKGVRADVQNIDNEVKDYASQAQASATSASQSATASANSATASANSASQSAHIKADVEELADDAHGYANSASQSASQASASEQGCARAVSDATSAAAIARARADEASGYAQTASTKASEAVGCVETATQKATESAQSASQALTYKTDAESAKTASQTAQGLAESARDSAISAKTDAESARDEAQNLVDGISGKVEQIDSNTERIESLEDDRYKPYPTDTASGAIASFTDGADDIPLKSLVVNIDPEQDTSSGDPSPENICPISGWTGCEVNASGKNLLALPIEFRATTTVPQLFFIKKGTYKLHFSGMTNATSWRIGVWMRDANGNNLSDSAHKPYNGASWYVNPGYWMNGTNGNTKDCNVKIIENCYVRFFFVLGDTSASTVCNDAQLELDSSATDYEPYRGQTIPINWQTEAGTVYGGRLDAIRGVMTLTNYSCTPDNATRIKYGIDSQSNLPYAFFTFARRAIGTNLMARTLCSMYKAVATQRVDKTLKMWSTEADIWDSDLDVTSLDTVKAYFADLVIVYPLETPIEIQLDSHTLNSLYGQNNIFADTGDCSVEYRADTKLYIERLTQPEEDDMIADSAITSGQFFMIGNSLYRALANIASGATITVGTNAQRVSLSDALNLVNA